MTTSAKTSASNGATPETPAGERDEIADLLASLGEGTGYRVRLERRDARGESGDYLGTIDLTPELLDDVRERWGGGKYRGRVVDARGTYRRALTFGIAGAPRDDAAAATPGGDDRLDRLERIVKELATAMTTQHAPPAAPVDTLAQFAAMAKILGDLRPAPVAAATPAGSFAEQIQAFVAVQQMIEKASGGRDSGGMDVAALVDRGLTPLVGVVSKKLDNDARALALQEKRTLGAPAPAALAPALTPAPAASAPAPEDSSTMPQRPELAQILSQVPDLARAWLAGLADKDSDPTLYADVVLDALPANVYPLLPALLTAPDALDITAAAVPQWSKPGRLAWIHELYRAIVDHLNEASDEAPELEATPVTEQHTPR